MEQEHSNAPSRDVVGCLTKPCQGQSRESSKGLEPQRDVTLHKAESAWKPRRMQDQTETDKTIKITEEFYKKIRSTLNKLTPQKFQTLVKQVSEMEINTEERLKGVADLIFERAISEPCFCVAYASMCRYLAMIKVSSTSKQGEFVNFRAILLTRCQKEFEKDKDSVKEMEKRRKIIAETQDPKKREVLCEELKMVEIKAGNRSIGNIRFIGELFNLKMLTENIIHDCLFKLLRAKDEESLKCVCELLLRIGKTLDKEKAKPRMDQYFNQIDKIVQKKKTSSRVRFMLQDVTDLRKCKWIPNSKNTISMTMTQYPDVQYVRGGRKARGSMGPETGMGDNDRLTSVGKPNIRVERQSNDPSRLTITKQNLDKSNIQLGPVGGTNRFSGWQRGSTGGGARSFMEQEKPSAPSNRFSALSKPNDDSKDKLSTNPASGDNRGGGFGGFGRPRSQSTLKVKSNAPSNRFSALSKPGDNSRGRFGTVPAHGDSRIQGFVGFGRPQSRCTTPMSSMEQEKEQALAAVRDQIRERRRERELNKLEVQKNSKSSSTTAKELTEEEMEKETKIILNEYLQLQDIKEVIFDIKELKSPSVMHTFVSSAVNYVLQRSSIERNQTGILLHDLVKKNILSIPVYIQGLTGVIQFAVDMGNDIPNIWRYFGELIGPMVHDESVPLNFLRKVAEPLKENNKAGLLVAEVLHAASLTEGHEKVGYLWRQSSLQWEHFMPEDDVKKFIIDKKVEFTEPGWQRGSTGWEERNSMEQENSNTSSNSESEDESWGISGTNPAPATAKELTDEEKETKTILNEYLHFQDTKKVEFTAGNDSQPSTSTISISMEAIQDKLLQLLIKEKADNEVIFDWIKDSVDDSTIKSNKFIRALMTSVCESAITGSGSSARVLSEVIKNRGDLLQKYLDHRAESELQALYALQALVHKLEHPQGVLRTLFDTLYDEDIISEDGFNQWEKSKDPNEQEGKGVAMKQIVQFFTWLRDAEDDVSDS